MSFDSLPIWGVFLATIGLVMLALEVGSRLGRRSLARGAGKLEVSGAMVGAVMGLLAFMLAFTFNGAAGRHNDRKSLVIEEANAIETTWLRAGFLAEPHRSEMRGLLRSYVDIRVKAAAKEMAPADALHQTEALQTRMWNIAQVVGQQEPGSVMSGLFVQSLNEVLDLHVERITVAIRNRVPATIWEILYLLMVVGITMIGIQVGLSGVRHRGIELALAAAFSLVLFLIADLDRPQEGLIHVSQQAMQDLLARLSAH